MKKLNRFIRYTLLLYGLIVLVYFTFARPALINWGAKKEEIKMQLPGADLISDNRIVSTRAINIKAPPEKIWPWISQTGQNRGGFNSYYWLENIFGATMENASTIHPEWQDPLVGDTVYYGKNEGYALVSLVDKNRYYSLGGWTFFLQPINVGNTRLIVRYPSMEVRQSTFMKIYYYGLFEALHFIMESGMMMGIRQKAERL